MSGRELQLAAPSEARPPRSGCSAASRNVNVAATQPQKLNLNTA